MRVEDAPELRVGEVPCRCPGFRALSRPARACKHHDVGACVMCLYLPCNRASRESAVWKSGGSAGSSRMKLILCACESVRVRAGAERSDHPRVVPVARACPRLQRFAGGNRLVVDSWFFSLSPHLPAHMSGLPASREIFSRRRDARDLSAFILRSRREPDVPGVLV